MYQPTCSYSKGCSRPVYQSPKFGITNMCIFHSAHKDPQNFRDALARQIREWRNNNTREWDFRDWIFTDVERDRKDLAKRHNLFRRGVFPTVAIFDGAKFTVFSSFCGAVFLDEADFSNTEFDEFADFSFCTFRGLTSFTEGVFAKTAYFKSATFIADADTKHKANMGAVFFQHTKFIRDAVFEFVTLSVFACFENAVFSGEAKFNGANLTSNLDLSYASFGVQGIFSEVVIKANVKLIWPGRGYIADSGRRPGQLLIEELQFPKLESGRKGLLDLRDNELREGARLTIRNTRMGQLLLSGTDCRKIDWSKSSDYELRRDSSSQRRKLADEIYLRKDPTVFGKSKPTWGNLAETYQQLTDRYRKDLNHPVANDFERGIFECRLMAAWQKDSSGRRDWRNIILLALYKAASQFGSSIWRPVWITVALLIICAWTYGGLIYGGFFVWPNHWDIRTAWDSLVAAMRVVSLDRSWFSREIDAYAIGSFARFVTSSVALLQTILTATLVTLFIFAIRRRFKHSE